MNNKVKWFACISGGIICLLLLCLGSSTPIDILLTQWICFGAFFVIIALMCIIANIPSIPPKEEHIPRPNDVYIWKRKPSEDPFEKRRKGVVIIIDEIQNGYFSYWFISDNVQSIDGISSRGILNVEMEPSHSNSLDFLKDNYEYCPEYERAGKYIIKT